MSADAPDLIPATAQHAQPATGTAPSPARRRRGAFRLALTARRAVGSNRGRTDDPA